MRLIVDYTLCDGCGECADAFPQFFEMRDDKAWVVNEDLFFPEENEGIVTICPSYAISVQ